MLVSPSRSLQGPFRSPPSETRTPKEPGPLTNEQVVIYRRRCALGQEAPHAEKTNIYGSRIVGRNLPLHPGRRQTEAREARETQSLTTALLHIMYSKKHTCKKTYTYVCMYVCLYVCMYVCIYVCICTGIYIYIYIYICINILHALG